jgi:hypothetical protein
MDGTLRRVSSDGSWKLVFITAVKRATADPRTMNMKPLGCSDRRSILWKTVSTHEVCWEMARLNLLIVQSPLTATGASLLCKPWDMNKYSHMSVETFAFKHPTGEVYLSSLLELSEVLTLWVYVKSLEMTH